MRTYAIFTDLRILYQAGRQALTRTYKRHGVHDDTSRVVSCHVSMAGSMLRALLLCAALIARAAAGTNEAGLKFLEENKNKPGVITLPSGLQYKVLRTGDGDSHPTPDSSCECHYEGRTAQSYPSGETFDSSYARGSPTSFAPNQVIKGWTEAMQLMVRAAARANQRGRPAQHPLSASCVRAGRGRQMGNVCLCHLRRPLRRLHLLLRRETH